MATSSSCCPEETDLDLTTFTKRVEGLNGKPWKYSGQTTNVVCIEEDSKTVLCTLTAPSRVRRSDLSDLRKLGSCNIVNPETHTVECRKSVLDQTKRSLPSCFDTLADDCTECWTCRTNSCPDGWKETKKTFEIFTR